MKQVIKAAAIAASLSIFIMSGLSAQSDKKPESAYDLPQFNVQGIEMPEITKVIVPRIPSHLEGEKATMYFTIGKKGEVYNVRSKDRTPGKELPVIMKRALYGWKFTPPVNEDGAPVVIKVALPVRVTPEEMRSGEYVSAFEPLTLQLIARVN